MAALLGWKDMFRLIRDGYRYLLPTSDAGRTSEERCKQEPDCPKGFTHFDTLDQLEAWSEDRPDPIVLAC